MVLFKQARRFGLVMFFGRKPMWATVKPLVAVIAEPISRVASDPQIDQICFIVALGFVGLILCWMAVNVGAFIMQTLFERTRRRAGLVNLSNLWMGANFIVGMWLGINTNAEWGAGAALAVIVLFTVIAAFARLFTVQKLEEAERSI